jgi:hypothetical protein
MLREGEKIREQGKADKQVDKMLLALPSRPEMRSAANSMENGMSRPLSVLSRIRHIQVLFPICTIARQLSMTGNGVSIIAERASHAL